MNIVVLAGGLSPERDVSFMTGKNVAEALKISVNQINIKATTEEGLGFTGTGEGISSQAICALLPIANYAYEDVMESGCSGCKGCPKEK